MRQHSLCILLSAVFCLPAFSATTQQGTPATPDRDQSAQTKLSTAKSKQKSLADFTRVSTADTARKAAKDLAKESVTDNASEASGASDVLEFHAADPGTQGAAATLAKEPKKSALKNVHGDAYGALETRGAAKRAGGSVGATSKSGKSSIYVETDHTHETTPAPH